MTTFSSSNRRGKGNGKFGGRRKRGRPLDETTLRDLALSYAARFATTGAKLEAYLARKVRERGVAEDSDGRTRDLDIRGLVERLIELGYVNDDAYARMKSRDLTQRGYGARRVEQALWQAGVDETVREEHAPGEAESRDAALRYAKKRRFGPFGELVNDLEPQTRHKLEEKQVAALLRAGHSYEHARLIVDAESMEEVEEWAFEARQDDDRECE